MASVTSAIPEHVIGFKYQTEVWSMKERLTHRICNCVFIPNVSFNTGVTFAVTPSAEGLVVYDFGTAKMSSAPPTSLLADKKLKELFNGPNSFPNPEEVSQIKDAANKEAKEQIQVSTALILDIFKVMQKNLGKEEGQRKVIELSKDLFI